MTPCKPILKWSGGKQRHLKHILPRIPPHECYCEPFAGGLAVLFAKPRSPQEIINDFNGDLISFYLCAQRHLPEMIRITNLFLTSRRLFRLAIQHPGITELERASSFLLKNRSSFAGNMESFGVARKGHTGFPSKRGYILSTLRAASARLDSVIIENQPYERVLENYDAPETFFFLDPPYINTAGHNYSPWQEADIQTLCARLDKLKGKWLLTMNDMPCVRSLFAHCRITPISSRVTAGNRLTTAGRRMIELLIEPA